MPSFISTKIANFDEFITPIQFSGYEGLDLTFAFHLDFLCHNPHLDLASLIDKPITTWLHHPNETSQLFNGIITGAKSDVINSEGKRKYEIKFESWFARLDEARDYRVFVNKNVIDITKEIFKNYSMHDYDLKGLTHHFTERAHTTQYNESPFNFLKRLWNDEGIYFYFTHDQDHHILHLVNHGQAFAKYSKDVIVNFNAEHAYRFEEWEHNIKMHSSSIEAHAYDYMFPKQIIKAKASTLNPRAFAGNTTHTRFIFGHDLPKELHRLKAKIKQKLLRINLDNDCVSAKGTYPNLSPGMQLSVITHPIEEEIGDYWIAFIQHTARDKFYRSDDTHAQHESTATTYYENQLIMHSIDYDYVPVQKISKPIMPSLDTAVVTGPPDKEIYVDHMARIKCQFHWDQHGSFNENSSTWVRTTQPFAGKHYGTQWLPRIGQTVLISHINSDPDFPIITGALPNIQNKPAFDLPQHQAQSGYRSHSFNNKDSKAGNELQFDDAKQGAINLKAQRNFNLHSTGNSSKTIQGDSINITQRGDWQLTVNNAYTLKSDKCIYLVCGDSVIKIDHGAVTFQAKQLEFGN